MSDNQNGRVAVYLDFDNIVLSWYDRVHGRNSFGRDRNRISETPNDPEIAARLEAAAVDVGAIIDYASSFGTLVLTRAYADWSSPVNALYRSQLVARAVDLVQLFPAAAYAKNGADIRLAVDTVEDMFRLDDLTHVVIVAGDSDYVPLAQRCKRLGRYVVGIGVAGSTAKALTAACDEFASYDALPGVERPGREELPVRSNRGRGGATAKRDEPTESVASEQATAQVAATGESASSTKSAESARTADSTQSVETVSAAKDAEASDTAEPTSSGRGSSGSRSRSRRSSRPAAQQRETPSSEEPGHEAIPYDAGLDAQASIGLEPGVDHDAEVDADEAEIELTGLLIRALWLGQEKEDADWLHSSAVKQQMRRMDPSFNEKALGYRSFSEFLKSRSDIAELEETGHERLVRLRDQSS